MNHSAVLLLWTLAAVILLVAMVARWKLPAFLALVLASLFAGLATGMKPAEIGKAFQDGVGGVLGTVAVVIGFGTVLGRLLAESGGAEVVANAFIRLFGQRRLHWAMALIAFVVGLPMFFAVGLVLLFPIFGALVRERKLPPMLLGVPLIAGLSLSHSLVPPHPGMMAAIGILKGDVGRSILWSILVALPIAMVAGPLIGRWNASLAIPSMPKLEALPARSTPPGGTPGLSLTLLTILLPVLLMLAGTIGDVFAPAVGRVRQWTAFVGHPVTAMASAVVFALWSFGAARGFSRKQLLDFSEGCLGPIASVLLAVGAGGGFGKVLMGCGVGDAIRELTGGWQVSPFVLGWAMAAALRVAVGSATVAVTTASGLIVPVIAGRTGVNLELLVVALGSGSLMFSHVNDAGFWIVKEYFNLTVPQTLRTWSLLTTVSSVLGLGGVLLISSITGGH